MRYTTNYNLNLPEYTDKQDINKINENTIFIDSKLKELSGQGGSTGAVESVNGKTGKVELDKTDIGLDKVINGKQMLVSGGVFEGDVYFKGNTIDLAVFQNCSEMVSNYGDISGNLIINTTKANAHVGSIKGNTTIYIYDLIEEDRFKKITLILSTTSNTFSVNFADNIKWLNGEKPKFDSPLDIYVLTFIGVGIPDFVIGKFEGIIGW